jgi:hypothetical protein
MAGKNPMKKLVDFFKQVKCYTKIVSNFYKCIIFYILDILKYVIFFFPLAGYSFVTKTSVIKNTQAFNYMLRWDLKTLNQCYLCKKKKKKKNRMSFWQRMITEGFGKGKNLSSHAFFYFLLIVIISVYAVSFFSKSQPAA